jgi:GNAT superfamily N-acetyltransferase
MRPLTLDQLALLRHWLLPDRPGQLVGLHVLHTGHGTGWADRWPDPRAVAVETGGNWALLGDPGALRPSDLAARVTGFVAAPERFAPLLRAAFPGDDQPWDRVVLVLPGEPHRPRRPAAAVRRLGPADAPALAGLGEEIGWIASTWGGGAGLAAAGVAWGAFVDGRLAALACPFFVGERYEDLGVATEPVFRGRGLSGVCAAAVCDDVRGRGRTPTWTTSPDNAASLRVAGKLGFAPARRDRLHVVGVAVPEPARPEPGEP